MWQRSQEHRAPHNVQSREGRPHKRRRKNDAKVAVTVTSHAVILFKVHTTSPPFPSNVQVHQVTKFAALRASFSYNKLRCQIASRFLMSLRTGAAALWIK